MRFTLSKKTCDNFSEGKFTAFLSIDAYINIMITSTNHKIMKKFTNNDDGRFCDDIQYSTPLKYSMNSMRIKLPCS